MIPFDVAFLRLGIALVLGAIIGVEREWRHKTAGVKTNALVALGAAGFAIISDTFGAGNHNPAQLAAAVVSGIGFIGAGVILRRGGSVQGVTTAATLWANAAVAVAVGTGHLRVGAVGVAGVLFVQFAMRVVVRSIADRRHSHQLQHVEVRVECVEDALHAVNEAWNAFAAANQIVPLRRATSRRDGRMIWRVTFASVVARALDLATFEERIATSVERIETRQIPPEDPD